jgi:hypothetical protein
MIYTLVLKLGGGAVKSPLDRLRLDVDPEAVEDADAIASPPPRPPRAREPELRYTVFPLPCCRATPSSTARATSAF